MAGNDRQGELVISYLELRKLIGVVGMSLPFVLMAWGQFLPGQPAFQPSISDYYSFRTRDYFVGALCATACFLFTYRGYDRRDSIATKVAAVAAVGVAFFPNTGGTAEQLVHFLSAIVLFATLAYISLFLFTKSSGTKTREKILRNRVYRSCGLIIPACMVLIAVYYRFLQDTGLADLNPVLWLETVALVAFGLSWFVKGEALLKDS